MEMLIFSPWKVIVRMSFSKDDLSISCDQASQLVAPIMRLVRSRTFCERILLFQNMGQVDNCFIHTGSKKILDGVCSQLHLEKRFHEGPGFLQDPEDYGNLSSASTGFMLAEKTNGPGRLVVGFGVGFTASAGIMNYLNQARQERSDIFEHGLVRQNDDCFGYLREVEGFPMMPSTKLSSPLGGNSLGRSRSREPRSHPAGPLTNLPGGFPPVHLRHCQIGKDQIATLLSKNFENKRSTVCKLIPHVPITSSISARVSLTDDHRR